MEELYLSAKNMVDLKYPDGHEYRELFIVGLYGLLCKYREHEKLIWLLFMQLENYFDNKSVNEIIFDNKLDLEAINKSDAKQLKDVQLTEMIFSAFHSILDGSINKHPVGTPYYNVFTRALSLPLKIVKKLRIKNKSIIRILTHIEKASHEIMTGGEIDANNAMLHF